MRAILLAAGKGKRFGETTKHIPKPLIEVGGKALIQHTLEALPKQITECLVVTQHLGHQIVNFLETLRQPRKLSYCSQQFPGTGGALLSVKEQLKYDDFFLVVGTDDIFGAKI
jgi:NDP-sugar pyrophosphorylase family protein